MSQTKDAVRRAGFTLVELLIVIVIIAILALIVIPKLMAASRKAKDATLKHNLQTIRVALEKYECDMGEYPPTEDMKGLYDSTGLPESAWDGPYLKSDGAVIGDTSIPVNPFSTSSDVTVHWTYTPGDDLKIGKIIPAAVPSEKDFEGNYYSSY